MFQRKISHGWKKVIKKSEHVRSLLTNLFVALRTKLTKFSQSPTVRRKSAGLGIRGKLFSDISDTFVKAALAGAIPRINAKELFSAFNEDEGSGVTKNKYIRASHIYKLFRFY